MEIELTILAITLILLITIWLKRRRKTMRLFKDLGIPGPEPNLILGNLQEVNKLRFPGALRVWEKKYGKTFGFFMGPNPFLAVMDTDLLKQIQIKDFNSFINRPRFMPGGVMADEKYSQHVLAAVDERWKQQRALITPTFTSGKMKQMLPHMNEAINVLLSKIEDQSIKDASFDIYDMFKGLTLDVISRTAFGTQTNVQINSQDPFLLGAKELLKEGPVVGLALIAFCFPETKYVIGRLLKWKEIIKYHLAMSHVRALLSSCVDMIRWRKIDPKNRREDLLQLLLDAEMNTDLNSVSADSLTAGYESAETSSISSKIGEIGNKRNGKKKAKFTLTDAEVASNTVVFVFAGYETTSTALGFTSHVLVNHPEIQEKLREEVLDVQNQDGQIDYTSLSKLKYMDMVISEVLRFYSPVPITARKTTIETTYGNLRLPKDLSITVPIEILHHHPLYWSEPDKFIPERFAPENRHKINSLAYQPFGAGPRNCIGMRFALMEAKLALARLLSQYRLVPCPKTEIGKIDLQFKVAITMPKNGVFVKAEKL